MICIILGLNRLTRLGFYELLLVEVFAGCVGFDGVTGEEIEELIAET